MLHTQVELTSPTNEVEVWWLPVPAGRAKIGEKITRQSVDWRITQVCTTLPEDAIPAGARIAKNFSREAHTTAYMTI